MGRVEEKTKGKICIRREGKGKKGLSSVKRRKEKKGKIYWNEKKNEERK